MESVNEIRNAGGIETKVSRKNLPAEECIRGADVAGRAKRVSSEKQTNNLSRNKG